MLGKAVPGDDDTASLLVQLNRIAERAEVQVPDLRSSTAEGDGEAPAPEAPQHRKAQPAAPASPTEAAASTCRSGPRSGPPASA